MKAGPGRFHLVLTGNVHPRTEQGLPWDPEYRPMGLLLKREVETVVALDVAYDSGSAWLCAVDGQGREDRLDCGVRGTKGRDHGDRYFVHLWDGPNAAGYHGVFYVGRVNASRPAVQRGLGRPAHAEPPLRPEADEGGPAEASGS